MVFLIEGGVFLTCSAGVGSLTGTGSCFVEGGGGLDTEEPSDPAETPPSAPALPLNDLGGGGLGAFLGGLVFS